MFTKLLLVSYLLPTVVHAAETLDKIDADRKACLQASKAVKTSLVCERKALDESFWDFYADTALRMKDNPKRDDVLVGLRSSQSALETFRRSQCHVVGIAVETCIYFLTKSRLESFLVDLWG